VVASDRWVCVNVSREEWKCFSLIGFHILFLTISVSAHPLGNFSVNQYSRLEIEKSNIKIRQILDMAEIPTFQLQSEIDADKNGVMSENELNEYAEKITMINRLKFVPNQKTFC
jgi:hypothetical protein